MSTVGIRAAHPEQLAQFFTQTLGLPDNSTFTPYNTTVSTISLGNLQLEIAPSGRPAHTKAEHANPAAYRTLGFTAHSQPLARLLPELGRRSLRTSGVIPMLGSSRQGTPVKLWEQVYVDMMPATANWRRAIFSLSRRAATSSRIGALLERTLSGSLAVLTSFYQHDEAAALAEAEAALRERRGGMLGIRSVRKIVVGVPSMIAATRSWVPLLTPLAPNDQGFWQVGGGPAIRLRVQRQPGIATIVLNVASLEQAEHRLRALGLPLSFSYDRILCAVPGSPGIALEFAE